MNADRPPPARQLPLGLPHRAAMTRADFLTGSANREAIALIDGWPAWPAPVVLLAGPVGSGKSHLVEIWRAESGAIVTGAAALGAADVAATVTAGAVAVAAGQHISTSRRRRNAPGPACSRAAKSPAAARRRRPHR